MLRRVLCVDDEPNILQAFQRQFRGKFELETALGARLGLRALAEKGPFAVVVSDLRMPEMDGIEFLANVRHRAPDTVRVMLTGQADLNNAIEAVNQGQVFQFLTKPCPADMLARTLETGIQQYRLVTAERELLEQTLRGSIGVMSEILSLVNPVAFGRAERVRRYVLHIAGQLDLADRWQYELAAMLSQVGCVAMPPEVLRKYYDAQPLDERERAVLASHPRVGRDLLAKIPRLEAVAEMVAHQQTPWKVLDSPLKGVHIGAELLHVATAFDELVMRGAEPEAALEELRKSAKCPVELVNALARIEVERAASEVRPVGLAQLKTGMITNCDVRLKTGVLLIAKGQTITDSAIARLRTFAQTVGIVEPLSMIVARAPGADPPAELAAPSRVAEDLRPAPASAD